MNEKLSDELLRRGGYVLRGVVARKLSAKAAALEELLEECRKAISQVPNKTVFGIGGDGMTHWYLADELLSEIAAAQEEQE